MLSHLRFHRRAPSNPTSPLPDQLGSWESTAIHEHPQTTQDVSPLPDIRTRSSNSAQLPPVLPPIARVTSADSELAFPRSREDLRPVSQDSRIPPSAHQGNSNGSTGFMGGIALQNHHRMTAHQQVVQQQPEFTRPQRQQVQENLLSRSKPPPPPINTRFTSRLTPVSTKSQPSFTTPTDLAQNPGVGTGKRPVGARMATEPPNVSAGPETHKGKRGLPFLKNPVSTLLNRRKTAQPAPVLQPLPYPSEPTYDPRIRGTRIHDFSAPRPKRATPTTDTSTSPVVVNPGSEPARLQSVGENGYISGLTQQPGPLDRTSSVSPDKQEPYSPNTLESATPEAELFSVRRPPEQFAPPVPEKDVSPGSIHTASSTTSRAMSADTTVLPRTNSSRRTAKSNNPSLSRASTRASVMSSIPKHMKSTSSRFSFDMIGSASQEKILEERHRQREQEKKTYDDATGPRDSRFDDFDADDFDYDAMMDDDGLEERIPGVNAELEDDYDYELEDTADPDNDQENFAGFVFQRSNPTSSLASPHSPGMMATPRDANGKVIGFAMTKDTTPELPSTASPVYLQDMTFPDKQYDPSGLGLQELSIKDNEGTLNQQVPLQSDYQTSAVGSHQPQTTHGDDIYFVDGLADELDFEHDGTVFDESIFDNVDTDKYGRPIPGAFARAHDAMRAAQKEQISQRDSDEVVTSQLSVQSGVSQSTAHTSISVGLQPAAPIHETETEKALHVEPTLGQNTESAAVPGQDLLYQAALAAAAQKAAASGKFRRSSSPPLPAELTITSPTDSSESFHPPNLGGTLDDYEADDYAYSANDYEADEPFSTYVDDDAFDDDDFIAEANASALANDADGFYGQEFGFYSAPLPTNPHHHGHSHQNSTSLTTSANNVPLSAENLFQYANGGYFGPSSGAAGQGIFRSQSGRVVSREPNLTPITERSEYSNRNSVMSLALPPAIGSEGGGGGRNSSAGMPASPGLAQLALLSSSEDDGTMSLSALMRLRNKAWGGSQGSSREGSPRSERAGGGGGGLPVGDGSSSPFGVYQHGRKGSSFSVWSASSDVNGGGVSGQQQNVMNLNLNGENQGSGPASPTQTMMMPQPMAVHTQAPLGMGMGMPMGGFGSPLAASPLPPPDQQLLQQHQLFTPPMPSPGHTNNNTCSPVLEGEEMEAGIDDGEEGEEGERTITISGSGSGSGFSQQVNLPSPSHVPNPLYPQWGHLNINGSSGVNNTAMLPTLHTGGHGNPVGGSRSGSSSPQLMRRPASASGSVSGGGFNSGTGMGHRHKGSADSISYVPVREDELLGGVGAGGDDGVLDGSEAGSLGKRGSGVTRWVMERRRTDESTGEVEILEREVVEGGRI